MMSEKEELIFMQTRLVRLASREWHLPIDEIFIIFGKADVLGYIEKCYGIFHCEGDDAVLEDITEFLQRNGVPISTRMLPAFCEKQKNMAVETISKERIDYTIDLLITWPSKHLQKIQEKVQRKYCRNSILPKPAEHFTMSRPDYGAMARPILPNYI